MPYLTTRKKLKLQLSPGLVACYDIQPGNGVGLFWDTTHNLDPHVITTHNHYIQLSAVTLSSTKDVDISILMTHTVHQRLTMRGRDILIDFDTVTVTVTVTDVFHVPTTLPPMQ